MLLRTITFLPICMAFLSLAACSSRMGSEEVFFITDNVPAKLANFCPPPSGDDIILTHDIEAHYGTREDNFTGVVKWTKDSLTVIALSQLGRLFSVQLSADEHVSGEASNLLPAHDKLRAQYPLWDMQLVLFPADKIQMALPAGTKIKERHAGAGLIREIFRGDEIISRIEFSGNNFESETITLRNIARGYSYIMTKQQ